MTLRDASRRQHNLGRSATLSRSGNYVTAGGQRFRLPVRISTTGLLGFNNRRYRGEFLLTNRFLINVLNVEYYVMGVVPVEGIPSWPMEFQKVQAIISRTFALRQSLSRAARGYDVGDTTADQVYRGAGVETAHTNQAVRATAGEVLTFNGQLAFTPFHSDSGGYTATNSHVWVQDLSYLVGVREPFASQSPRASWTARISTTQVQAALSRMNINVGRVREIRITQFDAGGRATTLEFVGSNGRASGRSSRFRHFVGSNTLRSTLWTGGAPGAPIVAATEPAPAAPTQTQGTTSDWPDISHLIPITGGASAQAAPPPSEPQPLTPPVPTSNIPLSVSEAARLSRMTSEGVFTAAELMEMLLNPEKRRGYLHIGLQRGGATPRPQPEPPREAPPSVLPTPAPGVGMPALRAADVIREENGYFVFHGRGWGHGVGLSQWGAMAMAREGWSAERILAHYYPGTTIMRFR